ncbi:hypothetical protein V2K06_18815, partial [Pseudomonas alliivorans]|nr:hypothetical protein [Pseudomonas alliivorans]MEE5111807.1 hypothetical protein [Pseudomonas alliivorans]
PSHKNRVYSVAWNFFCRAVWQRTNICGRRLAGDAIVLTHRAALIAGKPPPTKIASIQSPGIFSVALSGSEPISMGGGLPAMRLS